jgi:hypothetical protein
MGHRTMGHGSPYAQLAVCPTRRMPNSPYAQLASVRSTPQLDSPPALPRFIVDLVEANRVEHRFHHKRGNFRVTAPAPHIHHQVGH